MITANVMVSWQRSELETIKENIALLDGLKGQIKIQNCSGRPCVEVDTDVTYKGGLYILKGVKFK
jgi:hypothetical protein